MGAREILLFQIGNYSNYVATHWWNIQESYFGTDEKKPSEIWHDVLFREGKTIRGHPTFTPRTIVIDKKENAMLAPTLDDSSGRNSRRSSSSKTLNAVPADFNEIPPKHEYILDLEKMDRGQKVGVKDYNFEETTRTWCDFMKTRYHPKSMYLFNDSYQINTFQSGNDIYHSCEEEMVEKIRSYMEECNNLQGFQMLVTADDAGGSLADQIGLHLRDEYSSKTIFSVPVIRSHGGSSESATDDMRRMINILLTYQKLSEHNDLILPLSTNRSAWRGTGASVGFPHLNYDSRLMYHTSAILAAYLDTVTLKCRMRSDMGTLNEMMNGLTFWNRKLCAASLSLPFPMMTNSYLLDTLESHDDSIPFWSCMTPSCTIGDERIFYQRVTIRGVPQDRLHDPLSKKTNSQAYSCSSVPELFHLYLSFYVDAISEVNYAKTPLKTQIPFPKIFSQRVSRIGSVDKDGNRSSNVEVNSCPVVAGIHSCKDIGRMLENLHMNVKKINIKRFQQLIGTGMDLDDYRDCLEKILLLGNEYVNEMEL